MQLLPKSILNTLGLSSLLLPFFGNPVQAIAPSQIHSLATGDTHHPTLIAQSRNTLNQGRIYFNNGEFAQAAQIWQRAAQNYGSQGDITNQALSLSYSSLAYQKLRQWDEAQTAIESSLNLLSDAPKTTAIVWAQTLNTQASLLFGTGQTTSALDALEEAQNYYEQAGDEIGVIGSKINQAKALQILGFYGRAKVLLEEVNQQLATQPDSALKARSLSSLGATLQMVGDLGEAREILQESLAISQRLGANPLVFSNLLRLGNVSQSIGDMEAALDYWQQAEQYSSNTEQTVQAQLSQLRFYTLSQQWQKADSLAPVIYQQLNKLNPSRSTIFAAINLANSWQTLENKGKALKAGEIGQLLAKSLQSAKQLQDSEAQAHTLRQLAQVYETKNQLNQAVQLTQKSLAIAQQINALEISSQSAWQLGKLQKKQGKSEYAIAAYTRAVGDLKALRSDLAAINPDIQFSFRTSIEPVYRELVELLLQGNPNQDYLQQARQLIEDLQLAELDNFFREACLDANVAQIDEIDTSATVIYPIILPERLAVIVSAPGQPIGYHATDLPAAEVKETLKGFSETLNPIFSQEERLPYLQQVYDWLIRPSQGILADTETLVFVLDGKLRNLPMATLHDGEKYLVENYNVALSIGLQLLEPQPLQKEAITMITGGLSEARQGFQALPGVKKEIEQIAQNLTPDSVMLDEQFSSINITQEMGSKTANVVHLATHGQFSSNAEDTFLLTWEDKIQVKELDVLLRSHEFVGSPGIDLLVLSACQTAAGDDRAVLGIAGFAVKSGARSTIATLWSVRDASTAFFMTKFYEYLPQPGMTKAKALRQAQLDLINHPDFNEPLFWAPFVLVGNWL